MLLSMTGFGEAHCQENGLAVSVEVRTINSRYFKLSFKCAEGYAMLEPEIDAVVRRQIRRGTVQVGLRVDRFTEADHFQINQPVLSSYRRQLEQIQAAWQVPADVKLETLLTLPGVIAENPARAFDSAKDWPVIERTLEHAMDNLMRMRQDEGRAMAKDLLSNCQTVAQELLKIETRVPLVAEGYRARLTERLQKVLAEHDITLDPTDIIREVSIFAERGDISEEIVRLRSHLEQFDEIMSEPECSGRKLEFLTQEMFREINTIGSKANDVQIARHVIDIKAAIERMREMIQNVE